jgi:NADPH-dependent glutamate synthase beta subunit-like oxidoreductase
MMRIFTTPLLLSLVAVSGCASSVQPKTTATAPVDPKKKAEKNAVDDKPLCDFAGKKDVEVSETAGPGAVQPNVRRVWKLRGTGSDARKVLACREADTNLDGIKDVVRVYTEDGQSKEERADTNYDGKLDTWNVFSRGRLAEVRLDTNFDGEPDEWKTYVEGKLSRVKRDRNFDKKPDNWEMYRGGRLERIGVDLDGVFVQIGLLPNTEWLKGTVALNGRGEIEVDAKGQTSVPGVFAAGDVTTVPYKPIIIAMGEGSKAALGAFDHLIRSSVSDTNEIKLAA